MLKPAFTYGSEINKKFLEAAYDDRFKFHNSSNFNEFILDIKGDDYHQLQKVSVNTKDEVIGYFDASLERVGEYVSGISVINFTGKPNIIFSRDFYTFLTDLFIKFNFRKINWTVTIGNTAEQMYDKIIKKYYGRIVGVYYNHVRLRDGKWYDRKLYELHKDDFDARETRGKVNLILERRMK